MKDFIKKSVIRMCQHFGYEIVSSSLLVPRGITSHVKALFKIFEINCVLDVGANRGQYRDFLRGPVGYSGLILSFEPVEQTVEILNARAGTDPHWRIYHCGLGGENTTKTINVMHADDLSSFLDPDNSVPSIFSPYNVIDHTEDVRLRTLDAILDEIGVLHDRGQKLFLKMDTQGYDLEIVKGAEKALSEIFAVQTELSCQSLYRNIPSYLDVLEALNGRGYQLSGMFPVAQDTLLRVIECDCVLINGALVKDDKIGLMWPFGD